MSDRVRAGAPRTVVATLMLLGAVVAGLPALVGEAEAGVNPPSVNLEKLVNGQDADAAPGVLVPVGSTVTFRYVLELTSNLSPVVSVASLIDDNGTPGNLGDDFTPTLIDDGDGDSDLELGEIWVYEATEAAALGLNTNVATVDVVNVAGQRAGDSDSGNYTGIAAVPFPMPLMLLGSGLISLACIRARRSRPKA